MPYPLTPVTAFDGLTPPDRSDPATFPDRADLWMDAFPDFQSEINTLSGQVNVMATGAQDSAAAASTDADAAAASADAAAALAGAAMFSAATNYDQGDAAISAVDFQTYRRKTAGISATDPANDPTNWERVVTGMGAGGQVQTGNVVLTKTSGGAQSITPTGPGQYFQLPDATTMPEGAGLFNLRNAGEFDVRILNSAGTLKGFLRPFSNVVVGLADNSTAAGVWALDGAAMVGVTGQRDFAVAAGVGGTPRLRVVPLDVNRTCLMVGGISGTAVYSIIYDKSTQSWGSLTLAYSGTTITDFHAILSATNQVLLVIAHNPGTNNIRARTLSISGTTITPNATADGGGANVPSANTIDLVQVGAGFVFLWRSAAATTTQLTAISISGTTCTVGASAATTTDFTAGWQLQVVSATVVCALGTNGTNIIAQAYSLSGVVLTPGTHNSVSGGASAVSVLRAMMTGNGRLAVMFAFNSTSIGARLYSFSGTSITQADVTLAVAGASIGTAACDWAAISASKIAYISLGATNTARVNVITDTAGTPSVGGTPLDIAMGFASALTACYAFPPSGNNVRFWATTSGSPGFMFTLLVDASGSSPVTVDIKRARRGTGGITSPQSSDAKSLRHPAGVTNGAIASGLPGALSDPTHLTVGAAIDAIESSFTPICTFSPNDNGARGWSSRESWGLQDDGYAFQLVEMAA